MRIIGLIAVGMAAAMTACSGGGSSGTLPAGRTTTASSVAAPATVRTISENDGSCGSGHREDSASRGVRDRDRGDGDHGTSSSCCPPAGGTSGGTGGTGTGTRDRDRHNDEEGGNKPPVTCCIPAATPAPGVGGPGTRDRGRHDDDGGDGHHATPTPAPTLPPCPPNLTVTPASLTINCAVSPNAIITVKGTPAGITAVSTDPTVAVVFLPTVVNGNTQFVVQGVAGLSTTITITDTAGDKITVPVTTANCPLPTPLPSPILTPTPSPTPGR